MSLTLKALKKMTEVDKVIIHSHDVSLYLVSVIHQGEEHYIVDEQGAPLKSHNKLKLQALFAKISVGETVLRQESAYDEMVGLPASESGNTLEVNIGNTQLGVMDGKKP